MNILKSPLFKATFGFFLGLLIFAGAFYLSTLAMFANVINRSVWVTPFMYHTFIIIISFLFMLLFSKGRLKTYGFAKCKPFPIISLIINGLLIGFVGGFLIYYFNKEELGFIPFYRLWEKIVFIWVFSSISEEILVSGLVQSYMMDAKKFFIRIFDLKISLPVVLSAIVFAAMYFPMFLYGMDLVPKLLISLVLFVLGISKAYFREKSESIATPILLHFIYNFGVWCIVFLLK